MFCDGRGGMDEGRIDARRRRAAQRRHNIGDTKDGRVNRVIKIHCTEELISE